MPSARHRLRAAPAAVPAACSPRRCGARPAATRRARTACAQQAAHDYLSEHASCIVVYELEGDLYFGSMERVFRRIAADLETVRFVVLDCKRVTSVDAAARSMLLALEAELAGTGRALAISYVRRESLVYEQLEELHARGVRAYPDTDEALEVFEEILLAEAARRDHGPRAGARGAGAARGMSRRRARRDRAGRRAAARQRR